MNDFATVDEHNTVKLVRDLPGPVERVWAFLTDPKLFSQWFSDGVVPNYVGGAVHFAMGADGQITSYDPPHILEYTWNERDHSRGPILDTIVRWELASVDNRVRLTLTHKRLSKPEAIQHGAGWHTFVDRLSECVGGGEPPEIMEHFARLQKQYGKHFNVAL